MSETLKAVYSKFWLQTQSPPSKISGSKVQALAMSQCQAIPTLQGRDLKRALPFSADNELSPDSCWALLKHTFTNWQLTHVVNQDRDFRQVESPTGGQIADPWVPHASEKVS